MLLFSISWKVQLREAQQDGVGGMVGSTGIRGEGEASRSERAGGRAAVRLRVVRVRRVRIEVVFMVALSSGGFGLQNSYFVK